ncbi:unnamed protein product, partial [Prorocentrum cordatum]
RVQLLLQLCHRADAAAMGALPYFDISWALIVAVAAEGDHGGGGAALLEHPAPSCRPLWGATAELTRLLSEELGRLELRSSFVHGELMPSICGKGSHKAPSPDDLPATGLQAAVRHQAGEIVARQRNISGAVDWGAACTGADHDAEDSDVPNDKDASPFCPRVLFQATIKATKPDLLSALLLESGTDVHAVDLKGNSVMHFWARATIGRDHLMTIGAELLGAGADLNAQRTDGMSPLHHVSARTAAAGGSTSTRATDALQLCPPPLPRHAHRRQALGLEATDHQDCLGGSPNAARQAKRSCQDGPDLDQSRRIVGALVSSRREKITRSPRPAPASQGTISPRALRVRRLPSPPVVCRSGAPLPPRARRGCLELASSALLPPQTLWVMKK